jgi:asparagine synthase (glutamine-hydrolysing)
MDCFCRHGDQPFAVSSGFGILAVARAAREAGIKVLLSGDGADEAFGGYSWYAHLERRARGGGVVADGIVSFQNFGLALDARLAAIDRMPPSAQGWAWHYYAHEDEKAALFSTDFRQGLRTSLRFFDGLDPGAQPVDFVSHDRDFYFPNEMLRKLDRMTMAYSVEGRAPFAAPSVLSHARKLGMHDMIAPDGSLKDILRRAFADMLPDEVVRRPKHGFNVPIDHWLKGEWSDLVDATFAPSSALVRMDIAAPGAGQIARAMLQDQQRLNGHSIFCMIMLNAWFEQGDNGNHC